MTNAPSYPHAPIRSVNALIRAIGFAGTNGELLKICTLAGECYSEFEQPKPNGRSRIIAEAKPPLKSVQERIKRSILNRVVFPPYIQGGVRDRARPRSPRSNAQLHAGSSVQLTEDIENFFGTVTEDQVFRIFRHFFGFGDEVAGHLTRLTCRKGSLPQGASTSSALANLVFWDREDQLVEALARRGFRYSRFVDDVTVSHPNRCRHQTVAWAQQKLRSFFTQYGFVLQDSKSTVQRSNDRMMCTKQVNNVKPSLTKERRSEIRSEVRKLERLAALGYRTSADYTIAYKSVLGKAAHCKHLHQNLGSALLARLEKIRPTRKSKGRRPKHSSIWTPAMTWALSEF